MLYNTLGAEAVLSLLRLWGGAQISREWQGLDLSPKKLKAICGFPGCEQKLWDAFTDPEFPWLDHSEDGTYSIHGFEEHQAQVIALWANGKKGGRPPKAKEKVTPPLTHAPPLPPHGSQPVLLSEPNANQMVLRDEPPAKKLKAKGTLEELIAFAQEIGLPASDGEAMFYKWEGNGWKNDGQPVKDWRSTIRSWKVSGYMPSQKKAGPAVRHDIPLDLGGRKPSAIRGIPQVPASGDSSLPDFGQPTVREVVALYPKRHRVAEAEAALEAHANKGTDLDAVAAGTRAIAAIIQRMPGGAENVYVPSALTFFQNRRWEDDPKTWLRNAGQNGAPVEELFQGGGRKGTVIELKCP